MPKVGMEKIRRQQLIDATLESIEMHGLQGTTISTISKQAGVSSGIISHYFGGKAGLLEACVKFLLLTLREDLITNLKGGNRDHLARLYAIIDANFNGLQKSQKAAVTWLAFWAQSMHSEELARLQRINASRLVSNLKYSLRHLVSTEQVTWCANMLAAQIDGFWLRSALSNDDQSYLDAVDTCKRLISKVVEDYPKQ
jgi:TetR/AcrR family transcriptional repressor of bet genes